MISTYVRYDIRNPASEREACLDVAHYVGFKTTKLMLQAIADPEFTLPVFRLMAEFAGIRGYPVNAMWSRYRKGLNDKAATSACKFI